MNLRRFTSAGMTAFRDHLDALVHDPGRDTPTFLLEDDTYSELVSARVDVGAVPLASRIEAGRQLSAWLDAAGVVAPERDGAMWTWLSLLLFDSVCPRDGHGHRKPRKYNRHVAEVDKWQKRMRHLLLSAYVVYRAHRDDPDRALALLWQPLDKPGNIVEQIGQRQEYWSNRNVVEAATTLYFDPERRRDRTGAQNKTKGGVVRFTDLLNQLDLTWYLYGMSSAELIAILPEREFERFRPKHAPGTAFG